MFAVSFIAVLSAHSHLAGAQPGATKTPVCDDPPDAATCPTFEMQRRWEVWKPWAVVAGGTAVALTGLLFRSAAHTAREDYAQEIRDRCPSGCRASDIPAGVTEKSEQADRWQAMEFGSYALGAGGLVAGAILVYLNRERLVAVAADDGVSLIPSVSRQQSTVSVGLRF